MQYQEYKIIPELRPYVKVVWSMDSVGQVIKGDPMRILPDTCVELVIHYNDPFQTTFSDGSRSMQRQSLVICQMKSFMEIEPCGKTGFIAVRFSAWGAYHFFDTPMKEIANGETMLQQVWGSVADQLEDRIASAKTNLQRSEIIQRFLLSKLSKSNDVNHAISFSLGEINKAKGQISIEELAYDTGVTTRQLGRLFDRYIGLSPKEFARITKFLNALELLNTRRSATLTSIAYDAGYYDQAHFIHDFKEYAGVTPAEYLLSENIIY